MSSKIAKLTTLCLACLALIVIPFETLQAAETQAQKKPFRVLVDASKDGGLWWFPQGEGGVFDPRQPHQGKPLADLLRRQQWEVVELPRGDVITVEKLRDFDLIIKPPAYFSYTADEAMAYLNSIVAGARVLLLGGGNAANNDAITQMFGLRFESRSRFGSLKQWMSHPLTADVECCNVAWTAVSEAPNNAVLLAWFNRGEVNPRPVLGYLHYGNGCVVFVGQTLIPVSTGRAFPLTLIKALARHSIDELRSLPQGPLVFAEEGFETAPRLAEPVAEAILPQPGMGEWRFDWDDVPSAKEYEIVVLGPDAAFPAIRARSTTSEFIQTVRPATHIIDAHLSGWSVRVRVLYDNGKWGPWSQIRRFNVAPRPLANSRP